MMINTITNCGNDLDNKEYWESYKETEGLQFLKNWLNNRTPAQGYEYRTTWTHDGVLIDVFLDTPEMVKTESIGIKCTEKQIDKINNILENKGCN